jgi:hypothetical protein
MAGGYSIVDVVDDTSTKVVQGVRRMSWLTIMTIGATFMISLTFILAVVALANVSRGVGAYACVCACTCACLCVRVCVWVGVCVRACASA